MKKFFTYTLATAMALGSLTAINSVWAAGTELRSEVAGADAANKDRTQVSQKGFAAMQTIHAARLAIFNGDTEAAKEMLGRANGLMKELAEDKYDYQAQEGQVPINGSITLAKSFVPNEQHAEFLAKANEYFKKGQKEQGMEQLRQGDIDVNFTRVLMPFDSTSEKLGEAIDLANQSKYYESNLALKAAEDGMGFDSVSLFEETAKDLK
ncbi:MAG: YfdX family protein [Mariniblastus sp.]|nr:YfdX family protein [Mariniblastus sp.]